MDIELLDRAYDIAHLGNDMQVKVVRHVRTPAGVRRYKQPVGSIIVRDRRLENLTSLDPKYAGWERMKDSSGKDYSIGYDDQLKKWIVTEGADGWKPILKADTEDAIYEALDKRVAPKGKAPTLPKKPANATSRFDPEKDLGRRQRAEYDSLSAVQQSDYTRQRRDGATHRSALDSVKGRVGAPRNPKPRPKAERIDGSPKMTDNQRAEFDRMSENAQGKYKNYRSQGYNHRDAMDTVFRDIAMEGHQQTLINRANERATQSVDTPNQRVRMNNTAEQNREVDSLNGGVARTMYGPHHPVAKYYRARRSGATHEEAMQEARGRKPAFRLSQLSDMSDNDLRRVIEDRNESATRRREAMNLLNERGIAEQREKDNVFDLSDPQKRDVAKLYEPQRQLYEVHRASGLTHNAALDRVYRKSPASIAKLAVGLGRPVDPWNFTTERRQRIQDDYNRWVAEADSEERAALLSEFRRLSKSGGLTQRDKAAVNVAMAWLEDMMKGKKTSDLEETIETKNNEPWRAFL